MTTWRTIFMGTPDFACPTLQKLIARDEQIVAVVTQPDRPKGRGQKMLPPPVKVLAELNGIPVFQPPKVRDPAFIEIIRDLKPDVIVVVAFGQILPKALLDIPPQGCINVHASLLPRYRGAAPLNWCLMNGETETGVTTMLMDVGLDTGDMLLTRKITLDDEENIVSLHDQMAVMGGELLGETLDRLAAGELVPVPQHDADSCYAPMLNKEHGIINWDTDARAIHNQVRALAVWPGASTVIGGQVLKVFRTRIGDGSGLPGSVLQAARNSFEVACRSGSLFLEELQLAGKKRLPCSSFLAGHAILPGTLLTSDTAGDQQL